MAITETSTKPRGRKLVLCALALLGLIAGGYYGWKALETNVLSQRIHMLRCAQQQLRRGMTQDELEDLFGIRPEDRKATVTDVVSYKVEGIMLEGRPLPTRKHEGIKWHFEEKNAQGTTVIYSEWYVGWIVTSSHIVVVDYDKEGRVTMWKWL